MADVYRLYGNELSPYSVKVRSYFRYKRIPHAWLIRNATTEAEFCNREKGRRRTSDVTSPEKRATSDAYPPLSTQKQIEPIADAVLRFLELRFSDVIGRVRQLDLF